MAQILFYIFAAASIIGAICVVFPPFGPNPVYSALALISTLFFMACTFVLLHATFIAVLQILVYAGAIMVLFTFVIMLLNLSREELGEERITVTKIVGFAVVLLGVTYQIGVILWNYTMDPAKIDIVGKGPDSPGFGTIQAVGVQIFKDFLIPFEVTSILLLVAIIGAVVLAKKRV